MVTVTQAPVVSAAEDAAAQPFCRRDIQYLEDFSTGRKGLRCRQID